MIKKITFKLSILFFWLQGTISTDNRFVHVQTTSSIGGIIPAGERQETIPLKNISSTRIEFKLKIFATLLGLVSAARTYEALSSISLGGLVWSLFWLVLAIHFLSIGLRYELTIQRAGNDYHISVPFFEKRKLVEAQQAIVNGLTIDTDKTDMGLYFDKK